MARANNEMMQGGSFYKPVQQSDLHFRMCRYVWRHQNLRTHLCCFMAGVYDFKVSLTDFLDATAGLMDHN